MRPPRSSPSLWPSWSLRPWRQPPAAPAKRPPRRPRRSSRGVARLRQVLRDLPRPGRQRLRGRQRAVAAQLHVPRVGDGRLPRARESTRAGRARRWPRSPAVWAGRSGPAEVDAIVAFLRDGGPAVRAVPSGPIVGDVKRGKMLYDATCARCHGTQTQRSSAVHLANPVLLATASDGFLRWAIEVGRPPTSMVPWKGHAQPRADRRRGRLRALDGRDARPPRRFRPPSAGERAAAAAQGPIVLNPRGKAPDFVLKEDLYVSIAAGEEGAR